MGSDMSPLHILIGIWYHSSGTGLDYEAGTSHGESPAAAECCADLECAGLLKENHGASAVKRKYEPTDGLAVWLANLCEVPFPELRWVAHANPKAWERG
jgi:hypothetical protein